MDICTLRGYIRCRMSRMTLVGDRKDVIKSLAPHTARREGTSNPTHRASDRASECPTSKRLAGKPTAGREKRNTELFEDSFGKRSSCITKDGIQYTPPPVLSGEASSREKASQIYYTTAGILPHCRHSWVPLCSLAGWLAGCR